MTTVKRLYTTFKPKHYQLHFFIDNTALNFKGVAIIDGKQLQADTFSLHLKDLTITRLLVNKKETSYTIDNDEVTIKNKQPGEVNVEIHYTGIITDAMHGIYPCYYQENGVKKHIIATQFESHHAREAFPCVDEPEAKATFDVAITTDTAGEILSNMPVTTKKDDTTVFATTPRMSTYLLAFAIGELQRKTTKTKGGVEVNVYATPVQPSDSLDFALDHAAKTIDFFDEYFDTPYPLPKSDHIALPDFSSGAMENWGLVTYRESALLVEPGVTNISSKQYIATVISHELSHQWFGNLVTMKWWDNLWLNESFATLMEYIAVDAIHPEWKAWEDFASGECISALRRDAIDGVQSVQTAVNHPDEISTLFDGSIVYAKGARLLQMLQHTIGDTAFRNGLRDYFAQHAYKNTVETDLWQSLSDASGKDVAALMTPWISQSGYPIVRISEKDATYTLTQEQFFIGPHKASKKTWPIPLPNGDIMREKTLHIPADINFRINNQSSSHILTSYPAAIQQKLLDDIRSKKLTVVERLSYIHEQTLLARGGVISSAELLPLIQAYQHEDNDQVWGMIGIAFAELKKFVEGEKEAEQQLRKLARTIAREQYSRLGWKKQPNESEGDTKLRKEVISMMIYGRDEEALATAYKLFKQADKLEQLDPELRTQLLGVAVRWHETPELIASLIEQYKTTPSAELKSTIMSGLCATIDKTTIAKLIKLLTDTSTIRPQDTFIWYYHLLTGYHSREQTWQWCRDNWDWIKTTFSGDKSYDYFPRYTALGLKSQRHLDEYVAFFTPLKNIPALTRVIEMGITDIRGKVELIERDKPAVQAALAKL